jgi:hypothetical protein
MSLIIIDADACPAKDEIITLAMEYDVGVLLVASYAHRMPTAKNVTVKQVDSSPQAVDIVIMNEVKSQDIVITQDYGLAAVILGKGARVVSPRGKQYLAENITGLLEMRNVHARIRRGGGRVKGPAAYTKADKEQLLATLRQLLPGR